MNACKRPGFEWPIKNRLIYRINNWQPISSRIDNQSTNEEAPCLYEAWFWMAWRTASFPSFTFSVVFTAWKKRHFIQPDRINMAVLFWYLIKKTCPVYTTVQCTRVHLTSHFLHGTKNHLCLVTLYSVMQSDRNSWKIFTFLVAITSERMISFQFWKLLLVRIRV